MHISRSKSLLNILTTWLISKSQYHWAGAEVAGTLQERVRIPCALHMLKKSSETISVSSVKQRKTQLSWGWGRVASDYSVPQNWPSWGKTAKSCVGHFQVVWMGGCGMSRLQEVVLLASHYHIADHPSLPPESSVLGAICLEWVQNLG